MQAKNSQSTSGMIALLGVGTLYGMYGIFTRLIGESFTAFTQALVKNGIAFILALLVMFLFKHKWVWPNKKELPWLLLWLFLGSFAMILMFIGFNNLPIGQTYFLLYSTMISFGLITGKVALQEKITPIKGISFIFSILGLFFIYADSFRFTTPALLILLAGACMGVWNTVTKKFSARFSDFGLVAIDGLTGAIVGLVGMLWLGQTLPSLGPNIDRSWFWISIFGTSQVVSIALMIYGFKRVEAQIGSLILPIEVVAATIFGFLFFAEIPTTFTFIGGALIGSAAILPGISTLIEAKAKK